jgi:hypothetical protein
MFGLSLTKIVLTIFVILAVWYGWRAFVRFQALRAARERAGEMPKPSAGAPAGTQGRTCGAFIAASRRVACGRKDCPFP